MKEHSGVTRLKSNEVQNNICRSQSIKYFSDRLLDFLYPNISKLNQAGGAFQFTGIGVDSSVMLQTDWAFYIQSGVVGIIDYDLPVIDDRDPFTFYNDVEYIPVADEIISVY